MQVFNDATAYIQNSVEGIPQEESSINSLHSGGNEFGMCINWNFQALKSLKFFVYLTIKEGNQNVRHLNSKTEECVFTIYIQNISSGLIFI